MTDPRAADAAPAAGPGHDLVRRINHLREAVLDLPWWPGRDEVVANLSKAADAAPAAEPGARGLCPFCPSRDVVTLGMRRYRCRGCWAEWLPGTPPAPQQPVAAAPAAEPDAWLLVMPRDMEAVRREMDLQARRFDAKPLPHVSVHLTRQDAEDKAQFFTDRFPRWYQFHRPTITPLYRPAPREQPTQGEPHREMCPCGDGPGHQPQWCPDYRCTTCGRGGEGEPQQDDALRVLDAISKARDMVSRLCLPRGSEGARDWTMSIPARPDHDPDLIIGQALQLERNEAEPSTPIQPRTLYADVARRALANDTRGD